MCKGRGRLTKMQKLRNQRFGNGERRKGGGRDIYRLISIFLRLGWLVNGFSDEINMEEV